MNQQSPSSWRVVTWKFKIYKFEPSKNRAFHWCSPKAINGEDPSQENLVFANSMFYLHFVQLASTSTANRKKNQQKCFIAKCIWYIWKLSKSFYESRYCLLHSTRTISLSAKSLVSWEFLMWLDKIWKNLGHLETKFQWQFFWLLHWNKLKIPLKSTPKNWIILWIWKICKKKENKYSRNK